MQSWPRLSPIDILICIGHISLVPGQCNRSQGCAPWNRGGDPSPGISRVAAGKNTAQGPRQRWRGPFAIMLWLNSISSGTRLKGIIPIIFDRSFNREPGRAHR